MKDSTRLSIENCAIVDGSQTDRNTFYPVYAQDSTVLRLNDSDIKRQRCGNYQDVSSLIVHRLICKNLDRGNALSALKSKHFLELLSSNFCKLIHY